MNSFISHFRPWLLALAGLVAIEGAYYAWARPPRLAWNSFLDLRFTEAESFQRLVAYEKIMAFENADPDIIQVGDSSGLHGVQPPVVMSHLPGYRYLNLGVATNLGFSGYYNLAKLQLDRSPHARYLVLYTSPIGGVPMKRLWDEDQKLMAPLIEKEFLNPFRRLVQLPTLAARKEVTDYVQYLNGRFQSNGAPLSTNRGYLAFHSVYRESNGWTRETDVEGDVPTNIYKAIAPGANPGQDADSAALRTAFRKIPKVTDETFFEWRTLSNVSYFDHVYGAFADLAREHGARLVLIFNPIPESAKDPAFEEFMDWKAIAAGLDRVRAKHPDAIVTKFDYWPDDRFSVFSHVSTLHARENSERVGMILKRIVGDARPSDPGRTTGIARQAAPVEIDFDQSFSGYGWTDMNGATSGFPLRYIGPLNKAWLHASLVAGGAYKLRAEIHADSAAFAQDIQLRVNEVDVLRQDSDAGRDGSFAEWMVPANLVDKYRGWVTLEFSLGAKAGNGANGMQAVRFRRVVLTPVVTR